MPSIRLLADVYIIHVWRGKSLKEFIESGVATNTWSHSSWETEAGEVWIWDQLGYTIRPRIDNLGVSRKTLHFFLNQQCAYDPACQNNDLTWGLPLSPRTQGVSVEIIKHGDRLLCAHHTGEGGEWKQTPLQASCPWMAALLLQSCLWCDSDFLSVTRSASVGNSSAEGFALGNDSCRL